ncbi:hypothetical protein V6N12_033960 [Hibiscus sabdariffa]|uniref:pectinesterase n=1 Tax=Hibiscus sabdariffa TaxID=183260 RepID=A0ABR2AK30_9ROSI
MAAKLPEVYAAICLVLLFAPIVLSQGTQIPAQRSQVNSWFASIIKPAKQRGRTLDPDVAKVEANPKIIKVKKGGGGDFDTITKAIASVPIGNCKRVIISIAPGVYKEKITIDRNKPFITLMGNPKNMPNVTFDGTAKKYGTVDSATIISFSSYFVAAYLNIWSAIYNWNLYGFQDTLCDDRGNHFYKNCNIRGIVDFIFGRGKSIYLDSDLYVVPDPRLTVITAQARESSSEDTGYSFVHGRVYGPAKDTFLGRAWRSSPRVVFSYSNMGKVVNPAGWSHNNQPNRAKTVYYGEYKCTGEGSSPSKRVPFAKKLTDKEAK